MKKVNKTDDIAVFFKIQFEIHGLSDTRSSATNNSCVSIDFCKSSPTLVN